MAFGRTRVDADAVADGVRRVARPLSTADDLDPLIDRIGDARYVLLTKPDSRGTDLFLVASFR